MGELVLVPHQETCLVISRPVAKETVLSTVDLVELAEVVYLSVESAHPAVLADLVGLAGLVDLVDSVSPTWVAATEQVSELDPLDLVAFQPPESELHPHRMEDRPLQPELVSHHQLEA